MGRHALLLDGRLFVADDDITVALETSVVRRILFAENDRVVAGQLLIELDPTATEADQQRLKRELLALRLDAARLAALTAALVDDGHPTLGSRTLPTDAKPADIAHQSRHLSRQYAEYRASLQALTLKQLVDPAKPPAQ